MDAQLTTHQDLLKDLYLSQDLTLDEVVVYMFEHHQIRTNKATCSRLFKQWGCRKNKRAQDWGLVDQCVKKRKSEGKKSQVLHNGMLIPEKTVQKEIARNVTTLQQLKYATVPNPSPPDGYSIVTPPSSKSNVDITGPVWGIFAIDNHEDQIKGFSFIDFLLESEHLDTSDFVLSRAEVKTCRLLSEAILRCAPCPEWVLEGRSTLIAPNLKLCSKNSAKVIVLTARSSRASIPLLSDYKAIIDILAWASCAENHIIAKILEDGIAHWAYEDVLDVALFIAVTVGRITMVSCLISAGVNVDLVDRDGITPLHVAAERNHPEMLELLLSKGANVNRTCKHGHTAWSRVCFLSSHDEVARILVQHGANPDFHLNQREHPLHEMVHKGDIESVAAGLRHGMNPSIVSSSGLSLIQQAVKNCHLEMVKLLMEAGAEMSRITVSDFPTPLEVLASYGKKRHSRVEAKMRIYEYLVDCGVFAAPEPIISDPAGSIIATEKEMRQSLESLSVSALQPENIYVGSGPPRNSYLAKHLAMAPSPALSQISLSIGSLFGNGRSLPPLERLHPSASSQSNGITRLPKHQSLKMPHPRW